MDYGIQYPLGFPDEARIEKHDVVNLAKNSEWNKLNSIIICKSTLGKVTAKFGDDKWDIFPYISGRKNYKTKFDFSQFNLSKSLLLELKLIVYGWMYHKSNRTNKLSKPTTLISRFSKLKIVYNFLQQNNLSSLSNLATKNNWLLFEKSITEKDYAFQTIQLIFGAINNVLILNNWLNKEFGFSFIESKKYSRHLSSRTAQQTLVIPERLCDAIYGKAIELVELAHSNRSKILSLKSALDINHLEGKKRVDQKIKSKRILYLTDSSGNIKNNQEYTNQIIKHKPLSSSNLIKKHLQGIKELSHIDSGIKFRQYYGQLTTACYICCGAFSGMRDSELGELKPDSYFCETFEGRDFHMLQSQTFKFGEKDETWIAAPIVKKAIELAASLTEIFRKSLINDDPETAPPLWLSQSIFRKPPVIICDWNDRLRRFCRFFNLVVTEADYQECIESNPNSLEKVRNTIFIGQPWLLVSHQFRRSLAFYTIKHRLGTTSSLKQQFKHLYLQMAEWYTYGGRAASSMSLKVDNELGALLEEHKIDDITMKLFNMTHGEEKLSGSHGKAIVVA